jgi:FdhD protein
MVSIEERAIHRFNDGNWSLEKDSIAVESVLSIDIKSPSKLERWVSILRTPGNDKALIRGLIHSEGVIKENTDFQIILNETSATILMADESYQIAARGRISNGSACGICGRQDFSDLLNLTHQCELKQFNIDNEIIVDLPNSMKDSQVAFSSTGGIHAAALFTPEGEMLLMMEDIGRHNAVDKVIGQAIIDDIEMPNCILCLSGRIGSELVLKAAAAKIAVIIAVGAASSMAIDLARDAGITLYGFTRDGSSVSYNRPIAQG